MIERRGPTLETTFAQTSVFAFRLRDVGQRLSDVPLQLHVHETLESPQSSATSAWSKNLCETIKKIITVFILYYCICSKGVGLDFHLFTEYKNLK